VVLDHQHGLVEIDQVRSHWRGGVAGARPQSYEQRWDAPPFKGQRDVKVFYPSTRGAKKIKGRASKQYQAFRIQERGNLLKQSTLARR